MYGGPPDMCVNAHQNYGREQKKIRIRTTSYTGGHLLDRFNKYIH